jgi:glycerol-3-phosphate responsive antiterminator
MSFTPLRTRSAAPGFASSESSEHICQLIEKGLRLISHFFILDSLAWKHPIKLVCSALFFSELILPHVLSVF